ncbi:AMP-dependent synthetase/ligase [Streptomyces polyrhachis]|uniref:AMP-dependent synthetase/ligase n=1 Tax=Streptomyces polyrhachis TaxID=1282885 RepID=A0ABW2GIZ4_9ACTN
MGVWQDMKRARKRPDLAARVRYEVTKKDGVVREVRASPLVAPATSGSCADIPFANAGEEPDAVVIRRRAEGSAESWTPITAAAFAEQVSALAKGLIAAGLRPGGRVAVMSRTRYEWCLLDFAIWTAGGQTVPIYPTSSADQVGWILRDAEVTHVAVETAAHAETVAEAAKDLPAAPQVWQFDAEGIAELTALGAEIGDAEATARREALTPDTVATICYTSGTTGRPKGVVLTHSAMLAESGNIVELLLPVFREVTGKTPSTLLFLPLAHILGRVLQLACLSARIEIGHWPSIRPDELRPEFRTFKPTFLVGVPYLFEKIHDTGRATAEKLGRGSSFQRADTIAVRFGEAYLQRYLGTGRGPGVKLALAWALYDLLVYRRVRKELGGRVSYAISGGSPLDRRLNLFFYAAKIVIYEGYGLTETTAAATLTPPLEPRPGSVGKPVPGTSIRIADDGEVQIKGPIVFSSYWGNQSATDEVLTDGWFATGDLGSLDEDGYLTITGRKKDLIITSGGKNVSPAVLEDRLRSRPPVGQCIVVGDNRSYIAALVTLDPDAMRHWLSIRKRDRATPLAELARDEELRADIQRAVDYANEAVSRAESIRSFAVIDGEFTEENGLLTPSLKVKRHEVAKVYAAEIEALYTK